MIHAIVEHLRLQAASRNVQPDHTLMLDAADQIERLRKSLADAVRLYECGALLAERVPDVTPGPGAWVNSARDALGNG